MSKYDLVVFDLDGTLVDSDLALIKVGLKLSEYFLPKKDLTIDDLLYINGPSLDESMPVLFPEANVKEVREKYYELAKDSVKDMTLFPSVIPLLEALKALKIKIAIFTSRSRHSLEIVLKRYQLANYMTLIVAGDDGFKSKPSGEALDYIMNSLGIKKEKTLFVGDNWRDTLAGADAKVDVAYLVPYRRKQSIKISAKYLINDLKEVLRIVKDE